MIRRIIKIDEDKCNGCGKCARACHEGAIDMIGGKAKLAREDYCDGLGDCLPACPTDAISFEEREAPEYNEDAVKKSKQAKSEHACPGHSLKTFNRDEVNIPNTRPAESKLSQWPCQIKLVPINAPYFNGADLLVAADCTAFAYGNFHNEFICGYITLIGCPKLDSIDYSEKLTAIIANNNIKSIKVARMEVPCCGGIELAVKRAIANSGKSIPVDVVIISTDGQILG